MIHRRGFLGMLLAFVAAPFAPAAAGPAWWEWLVHPKLARLKARSVKVAANRAYLLEHWGQVEISIRSGLTRKGYDGGEYTWIRGTFRHPSVPKTASAVTSCLTKHWAEFPMLQEL